MMCVGTVLLWNMKQKKTEYPSTVPIYYVVTMKPVHLATGYMGVHQLYLQLKIAKDMYEWASCRVNLQEIMLPSFL